MSRDGFVCYDVAYALHKKDVEVNLLYSFGTQALYLSCDVIGAERTADGFDFIPGQFPEKTGFGKAEQSKPIFDEIKPGCPSVDELRNR